MLTTALARGVRRAARAARSATWTRQWSRAPAIDPYKYPTTRSCRRVGVTGLFLGYYVPWDGFANALNAQANGFETLPQPVEGSMVNYENLDNPQTGIHDYFKFLKFGSPAPRTSRVCMSAAGG